ncbi:amino acid permease [Pantoea sp. Cy-639]|uniref:amino acid permease n=1 Tax=Pantoea sp. Cy-639 TaxID=2608360 RepID=UPI00141E23A4|nr:amino acid permease [Pantoea sp. Cy-639]NIF17689.1 amino acid permease [Pantoea sp. Cy-639]
MRRFGFILATLTLAMFLTAVYAPKPTVANRAAAAQMGHPIASIGEIFRGY